jgi:MerR family transcriptional regulator, thiopeptide resistance regulator
LQRVVYSLSQTLTTLETKDAVDWMQIIAIIQGLSEASQSEWMRQHYPPEWTDWLLERAAKMPPTMVEESAQAWRDLIAEFQQYAHLPPDHPDVQALAAQMSRLVEMFTDGNPEVAQAVSKIYSDMSQIPEAYRVPGLDAAMHNFMNQALVIYREQGEQT